MIDVKTEASRLLEDAIQAGRLPPKPDASALARIAAIVRTAPRKEKAADGATSSAAKQEVASASGALARTS